MPTTSSGGGAPMTDAESPRARRPTVPWWVVVLAITAAAVVVRLLVIAHSDGGEDLRMYTYFSRLPLHGVDPFHAPASALHPPTDSNNPPVEVATFAGLLAIHDSPTTLRLLFVLADAAIRLLLVTLPLLLLLDLSARRWLALWAISGVATVGAAIATRGVPHALAGVAAPLQTVFAHESTVRHVLWMNLLPALVLTWYLRDRRDRRAPVPATRQPS